MKFWFTAISDNFLKWGIELRMNFYMQSSFQWVWDTSPWSQGSTAYWLQREVGQTLNEMYWKVFKHVFKSVSIQQNS